MNNAQLRKIKKANRELHDKERAAGHIHLKSNPIQIQIEITSRCNLMCPICARPYYDKTQNPHGDISLDMLELIDPFLITAEEVVLGGYGEPLLGKDLFPVIEKCKSRGANTGIITNGTLLKREIACFLVDSQLDKLIFSIDGITDNILLKMRGIKFYEIIKGIEIINNLKKLKKTSKPELQVNFTLNNLNISELSKLIPICSLNKIVQINIAHQKIFTRNQDSWSVFTNPKIIPNHHNHLKMLEKKYNIALNFPSIEKSEKDCFQPFELLFIRWDGEVMACCSAIFRGHPHRFSLGSLYNTKIHSLWNSQKIKKYRIALLSSDHSYPISCNNCAFRFNVLDSHLRFLD